MLVFFDPVPVSTNPDRYAILYTAEGDVAALTAGKTNWIEVPDQEIDSLAGLYVEGGAVILDPQAPAYRTDLAARIDAERDRRMKAGLAYLGVTFDFDDVSKSRITGMAALAGFAIGQGAQPGDLNWHGQPTPFNWVAQDNTFVPMDAQTVFGLGQAAAIHEMTYIFAARALKDAAVIPTDFTDNAFWP